MRLKILLLTLFVNLCLVADSKALILIVPDSIPVKGNTSLLPTAAPPTSGNQPPIINNIPDQVISPGDTFPKLDLNNFLNEPNNDSVDWSYSFSDELSNDQSQNWSINPGSFQYSMTLTARMRVRDTFPNANAHKLAAFHDGQLRGVTTATPVGSNWLFYLTIFSNQANDSISFKYYHEGHSSIFMVDDSVKFVSLKQIGSTDQPYQMNAGFMTIEQNVSILCPRIISQDSMWSDTVYVVATETGTKEKHTATGRIIYRVGDNPNLPVDLISFKGEKQDRDVRLDWEIANPDNFWGFEIQRASYFSEQGELQWMPIGFLEHIADQFNYHYVDHTANLSDNYYRIKMIDFDDTYEFSNIINVSFEEDNPVEINFFPNPVAYQLFHLELVTEVVSPISIKIIDANGRTMLSKNLSSVGGRELIPIDIAQFDSGIYWANIKIGEKVAYRSFSIIRE